MGARAAIPILKRDDEDLTSEGLFEVVVLACANCGGVYMHERRVVADWVAKNPAS